MNGPEHYREAERLLGQAGHPRVLTGLPVLSDEDYHEVQSAPPTIVFGEGVEFHDSTIAAAQVHATLALAAATLMNRDAIRPSEISEWFNGGAR